MGGRNEGEDSRIDFIYAIVLVCAKRVIFNDHGRPRSNGEANFNAEEGDGKRKQDPMRLCREHLGAIGV